MPAKRPARRRNRKNPAQRGRRETKPNVFVQGSEPKSRDESAARWTGPGASAGQETAAPSPAIGGTPVVTRSRSAQRRQGRQRSEVFARSLPAELRKLSILVAAVAVALTVLTIALR